MYGGAVSISGKTNHFYDIDQKVKLQEPTSTNNRIGHDP